MKKDSDMGGITMGTADDKDAAYDKLRAKKTESEKAKGVLRGAGYARGGGVGRARHADAKEDKALIKKELKSVKITPKKHGGKIDGNKAKMRADKYARGGSVPKGHHTKININLGASQEDKKAAMQQGVVLGARMAAQKMAGGPRPGAGAPMQARGPMPPPGPGGMPGGAGPQGLAPTMQARGGRTYAKGGKVGPVRVKGVPHLEGGSGGAEGRLNKMKAYGTKPKSK